MEIQNISNRTSMGLISLIYEVYGMRLKNSFGSRLMIKYSKRHIFLRAFDLL